MSRRILIVDDEETIQTVAEFGIRMAAGWEVIAVSSGAEGIRTAQAKNPDVILLDIMMPGIDGIATFKALQANTATEKIPVIFLTAKAQTAERQFNDMGISGVISKPFNALDLPGQISKILQWPL
jgi:two-component system, OmpR family, alkaline phosphatase synthesis response regulator PhoP